MTEAPSHTRPCVPLELAASPVSGTTSAAVRATSLAPSSTCCCVCSRPLPRRCKGSFLVSKRSRLDRPEEKTVRLNRGSGRHPSPTCFACFDTRESSVQVDVQSPRLRRHCQCHQRDCLCHARALLIYRRQALYDGRPSMDVTLPTAADAFLGPAASTPVLSMAAEQHLMTPYPAM